MDRLTTPAAMRLAAERWRAAGMVIGLVPTMGALHEGHRSLIRRARAECDRVVVSIFVNPAQFGPAEDLDRYPRTPDADLAVLDAERADALYIPAVEVMYPSAAATSVHVGGRLGTTLEAEMRPGHLDGVALVVVKLLAASRPDRAYFGRKDGQQCAVIRRVVDDLDLGCEVVVCPVVRDPDGLALSSRNAYLDAAARQAALAIPAALADAAGRHAAGEHSPDRLRDAVCARLRGAPGLRVDYVSVVDEATLEPAETAAVGAEILIAARIGTTRLIDCLRLGLDEPPRVGMAAAVAQGSHMI